ncbi:elongation factor P--(R)-beta-lysine ligase [Buchnera aphidicola (Pseudoregma panicola)]|uniref:elongation factor P--(R)-beta-lysine ligase n=1 Tax=Buchnera aphidicola TaxID=9 RepID=UPI0031B700B2
MNKRKKYNNFINKKDLIYRSKILFKIRKFFNNLNIIEVDTPMLSRHAVPDCNIKCFKTKYYDNSIKNNIDLWMIPSPEYHMKRLLSLKIGSIYQICHSFRDEEFGKYHNPEFTILEFYIINCNMFKFIKKIDFFFQKIFNFKKSEIFSYKEIFIKFLNIDPFESNKEDLVKKIIYLEHFHLIKNLKFLYKKDLLEILFLIGIEKNLGKDRPIFIYHFPSDQSLSSSINKKNNNLANRFEVFFKGIEIANGFNELIDRKEQENRFNNENSIRKKIGLEKVKLDNFFLDALSKGIPKCSGVAIGIDRIIMIKLKKDNISQVIPFTIYNC